MAERRLGCTPRVLRYPHRHTVGTKLLQRLERWRIAVTTYQRGNSRRGWRLVSRRKDLPLRNDFIIEAAEEEHVIRPERAADSTTGKLIVEPRCLLHPFKRLLGI